MTVSITSVDDVSDGEQNPFIYAGGLVLLFTLLASMAASVDTTRFKENFKRPKAILVGLGCQFFILPLLGYMSVSIMKVSDVTSTALLIMTMVPGGAFSNWFCSLFNADLSLSVAMTTTSTILSLAVLPLNITLYVRYLYGSTVTLNYIKLLISVVSAAAGLITGLLISHYRPGWRKFCNIAGTVSGIVLMVYGAATSTVVTIPCLLGIVASQLLTLIVKLPASMATAIAIECSYQNTGIAMSIIFATFDSDSDTQGEALGVPIFYGTIQAITLVIYNMMMWKMGRTYAPPNISVLEMLKGNFQPAATMADYVPAKQASPMSSVGSPSTPPVDDFNENSIVKHLLSVEEQLFKEREQQEDGEIDMEMETADQTPLQVQTDYVELAE